METPMKNKRVYLGNLTGGGKSPVAEYGLGKKFYFVVFVSLKQIVESDEKPWSTMHTIAGKAMQRQLGKDFCDNAQITSFKFSEDGSILKGKAPVLFYGQHTVPSNPWPNVPVRCSIIPAK